MNDNSQTTDDNDGLLPQVAPSMAPPMQPMSMDPATSSAPQAPQAPVNIGAVTTPVEAGDVDLIEKEWVEKAKQIVEHTMDDPYSQQEALGQMKADYMKKRYNRDVGA
jgi:hypothetical protein